MSVKSSNEANLLKLMADNSQTEYGKQYDFSSIHSFDEYKRNVPISSYDTYVPYIDRMRQGEEKLLTAYEMAGFCKTSGSAGLVKYIPITREQLARFADHLLSFSNDYYKKCGGKRLMMSCFKIDYDKPISKPALLSEHHFQYIFKNGLRSFDDYAGGQVAIFNTDVENNLYVKAWLMLSEENITIIDSIYMYDILLLFRYIEYMWVEILEDMEDEAIPRKRHVAEDVCDYLISHIPSKERIRQINDVCSTGFKNFTRKLWPNLQLFNGISTRFSSSEQSGLDFYTGGIKKNYFGYCSSECMIGEALVINKFEYNLIMDTAVYEFREADAPDIMLLPEELVPGKCYEPVISNFSGLYRYPMGDIVKCIENTSDELRFVFERRKKLGINICGEKTSIEHLEKTVEMLKEKGLVLSDYCFGSYSESAPSHYILWGCVEKNEYEISAPQAAIYIDKFLKKINIDYSELRDEDSLNKPVCYLLDYRHYQNFREENGLNKGHNKPKHILGRAYEEKRIEP